MVPDIHSLLLWAALALHARGALMLVAPWGYIIPDAGAFRKVPVVLIRVQTGTCLGEGLIRPTAPPPSP